MITAIETIRAIAHAAHHRPAPRSAPGDPSGAPAGPGASLAGLLPRVALMLIRLLVARTPEGSTLRLVAQALATFLPLLDLDWLPADPTTIPVPAPQAEAHIELLRQERTSRARLRQLAAPGHRIQPDRPPASRTAAPDDDVWIELLDLTSRTLETYIAFGHQRGARQCAELIDLLADTFGEDRPAAA